MKPAKQAALEKAGWKVGSAEEFVGPAAFTASDIRATLLAHYKWQRAQVDDFLKTLAKDKVKHAKPAADRS